MINSYPYYEELVEQSKIYLKDAYLPLKSYFAESYKRKSHNQYHLTDPFFYVMATCLFPTPEILEGFKKKEFTDNLLRWFIHSIKIIRKIEELANTQGIIIPNKNLLFHLMSDHVQAKAAFYLQIELDLYSESKRFSIKLNSFKPILDSQRTIDVITRRLNDNPEFRSKTAKNSENFINAFFSEKENRTNSFKNWADNLPDAQNQNNSGSQKDGQAIVDSLIYMLGKLTGNNDANPSKKTSNDKTELEISMSSARQMQKGQTKWIFQNLPIGFDHNKISQRRFHIALYPFLHFFLKDDRRFITEDDFTENESERDSTNNFDEYKEQVVLSVMGKTKIKKS